MILAVLMGLTTVVMAQPNGKDEGKERKRGKQEMCADNQRVPGNGIDLTNAQKEAFQKSRTETEKLVQPLRNQLGEARAHQKTLTTAEKPDMEAINKNIEKMGYLQTEIEKIQTKHRLEMRAQLTEEQRLKMDNAGFRKGEGRDGGRGQMKHNSDFSMR
jgi:Spy/CpxP family protein refolding chaperone